MSATSRTLILPLTSILEPLDLRSLFPRTSGIEVELGSGDGSFITRYAGVHPESDFLGVERLLGRLRKIDRKGLRAGLINLRLVRIEATYLLEYLLPSQSVRALHVYFPDPWPKRKHQRHRLVNERFPELASKVLSPGGVVYLRTDHAGYFEQMTAVFETHRGFKEVTTPKALSEIRTEFETGFLASGVMPRRVAYARTWRSPTSDAAGVQNGE